MTPQSPTPGQALTEADVKLLRKGDLLRRRDGTIVTLIADGLPDASGGEAFIGRPDAYGWMPWSGGENPGDVRWLATEDGSQGKGTGRHIAAFILDGDALKSTAAKEGEKS